jgi:three-Cys-motif partner protein
MPKRTPVFHLPEMNGSTVKLDGLPNHIWTGNKSKVIERYLYYFALAAERGAYVDGFAGPQRPDEPDTWAAKLVFESEPRWLRHFILGEADPEKAKLLEGLWSPEREPRSGDSPREFDVVCLDFNLAVQTVLEFVPDDTQTFCLIDQRTFECQWETVRTLAARAVEGMKTELFYLLATGWPDRAFTGTRGDASVIEAWWGRPDWTKLVKMNSQERSEAFCARFRGELGYKFVYSWPVFSRRSGGRTMHHLIHASDHAAAPALMHRAYSHASGKKEPLKQLRPEFERWTALN